MITTKYHKISPNTIAKIEIRKRLLNNLWLLIFPAASFVLGATYNNAFLYVGLMLLFLLYPFLMILSYLNTLLLPSYVTGIKLRYVTFDDNEIILQCLKYDEENQIFSKTGNPSVSAYSDFQSFSVSKEIIIISYLNHKKGLIVVPLSSFENQQDAISALQLLQTKIK